MKKLIAVLVLGMFVGGVAFAADPTPKVTVTITKVDANTVKYVEVQTMGNMKVTREMNLNKIQLEQQLKIAQSAQTMVNAQNAQAKVDIDAKVKAISDAQTLLQ